MLSYPQLCRPDNATLQARLEQDAARIRGELDAAMKQVALVTADLAAERERSAAVAAALERKVSTCYCSLDHFQRQPILGARVDKHNCVLKGCWYGPVAVLLDETKLFVHDLPSAPDVQRVRKRHWKAGLADATREVAALHGRMVGRQKELDALEARARLLEVAAQTLVAGAQKPARQGSLATAINNTGVAEAGPPEDMVAAARCQYDIAAARVAALSRESLDRDAQLADAEAGLQVALVRSERWT